MSVSIGFEDITRIQLRESKDRINMELDNQMEYYYNTIIIPECKAMALAANTPKEFADGFKFVKTGRNRGKIINTFGSPELPLAKFFNYGTKKNYLIEPKVKHPAGSVRAERDKDIVGDDYEVQHPTVLKIPQPNGSFKFRAWTIHPGFVKSLAMEKGVEVGTNKLIEVSSKHIMEKFSKSGE